LPLSRGARIAARQGRPAGRIVREGHLRRNEMFRGCFKGLPTGKIAPRRREERRRGREGIFRWANLREEPRNISFL
jgi:hypothetical protein